MEKEKFKLCDDLQSIFKDAVELTKRYGYKEISYETIFYCILKRYIEDKEGKDEVLNDLFSNYEEIDKEKILEISKELMEDNFTSFSNPLPSTYSTAKFRLNPIISSQMNDVLIRAKKECDEFFGTDTIQTSNFYFSLMKENDQIIEYMAEEADMSCEELVKLLYKKSIDPKVVEEEDKETIGGEFKEKTIDTPNAVEGDDKEDKQPTPEEMAKMDKDDEEFEEAGKVFENAGGIPNMNNDIDPNSSTPFLDKFGVNLTKEAKENKLDPIIGREKEIEQIMEILCCRVKNNALILGPSGCGKSALASLLAQKIVKDDVPNKLKNKKIFSIDITRITQNCRYRGDLEARIMSLIDEVKRNPDIILYIEEAHTMSTIGGSSEGGGFMDMIKSSLSRGELRVLADTTWEDYRRYLEVDRSVIRRFQNVVVEEPTEEETFQILKGLNKRYSDYHRVKYSDDVLKACINYSKRYLPNLTFPDKAISVLDITGSIVSINNSKTIEKSEDEIKLDELRKKISSKVGEKIKAVRTQDFELAAKIKDEEKELKVELIKLQKNQDKKENNPKLWPDVSIDDVISVISKMSNVPVSKIKLSGMDKIRELKKQLESKVIGQQEAIDKITLDLQRNILGLRDENKPIAAIFALGMTGCGKTLIAREIAKIFFGSEKNLIRINLNELKDKTGVEALLGSKNGYIGYDSYVPLLDKVRQNPYCVLLLDEVDKLDPEVLDVFMSAIDDGVVKLSNGTDVYFRNSIIIFTGNTGTKSLALKGDGLGFSKLSKEEKIKDDRDTVMKELKKTIRPEFLNRLSDIIVFNSLGKEELNKIFYLELDKLKERLKKKNLKIMTTNKIRDKIVSECDLKYGARDLQRNIVKYIEDEICNALINSSVNLETISSISIDYYSKEDKVLVTFKEKSKKTTSKEKDIKIIETKTTESQPVE